METEQRTRAILVRLTAAEYETVFEAAKLLEVPITAFARQVTAAAGGRVLEAATVTITDQLEDSSNCLPPTDAELGDAYHTGEGA